MENELKSLLWGVLIGVNACNGLYLLMRPGSDMVPSTKQVESGYIAPKGIKIKCEDLDKRDGAKLPETYVTIDGKSYALRRDIRGQPMLVPYQIVNERSYRLDYDEKGTPVLSDIEASSTTLESKTK